MNYRFKAWVSRAGKSLIFVQVSLDWLSMEVFHLMGQVLLRTPLLAPHRFLSLLERGAEIIKRDFPSSRFLVCSLHIILFKQSIVSITQDSRKHLIHWSSRLWSQSWPRCGRTDVTPRPRKPAFVFRPRRGLRVAGRCQGLRLDYLLPIPAPPPASWPDLEQVSMSALRRSQNKYKRLLLILKHMKLPIFDCFWPTKMAISHSWSKYLL